MKRGKEREEECERNNIVEEKGRRRERERKKERKEGSEGEGGRWKWTEGAGPSYPFLFGLLSVFIFSFIS